MTTIIGLLRLFKVVKTIAVCIVTAMGPGTPKVSQEPPPLIWAVPVPQEEGKDNMLEAAKGLLRLRNEQLPEQANKPKEELPNGVRYERAHAITRRRTT